MQGTEKQISWAEDIRAEFIANAKAKISKLRRSPVAPDVQKRVASLAVKIRLVSRSESASWFINHRKEFQGNPEDAGHLWSGLCRSEEFRSELAAEFERTPRHWTNREKRAIIAEYRTAKRGTKKNVLAKHGIHRSYIYRWEKSLAIQDAMRNLKKIARRERDERARTEYRKSLEAAAKAA